MAANNRLPEVLIAIKICKEEKIGLKGKKKG